MSEDAIKLTALGKIKAGVPLREIMDDLEISYPKLLKWRKELQAAEESGTVHKLINTDALVISEIAEHIKQDLEDLVGSNPEEVAAIEGELQGAIKSIDGIKMLNTAAQTCALKLVNKVSQLTDRVDTPGELEVLVSSLAKLQTAFFNQAQTTVNVLNQNNGVSSSEISAFRSIMRS